MDIVQENIDWNLGQAYLFVMDAQEKSLQDRSRYYKAAFLFASSAVEALVFMLVKNYCTKNTVEYGGEDVYHHLQDLKESFLKEVKTNESIGIYKREKKEFEWKDRIDFYTTNDIGLKNKVFGKRMYNKLEKIREQRNKTHLQSLREKDHQYTKRDVEYASLVTEELISSLS